MTTIRLQPLSGDVGPAVRALGWEWAVEEACENYVAREAVLLPEAEADRLMAAADTLYALCVESVPDPVPDEFLQLLAIPANLWAAVRHSWNDDRHWHLYGRFDLASTPQGPKLIEFNADTATSIPETAVVQWASLVASSQADDDRQANGLFEGLEAQLNQWRLLNPDLDTSLLLVYLPDSAEDAANCSVIAEAARISGFTRIYACPVDAMQVSVTGEDRGVWAEVENGQWQRFAFLFKLVPWEIIAGEEPELTADLTQLQLSRDVIIANPAYALILQSKGLLAWLWQVYPHHPLLLEAALEDLDGRYVRKPLLGREGQNIVEIEAGQVRQEQPGEFAHQPQVRQRWVQLPTDVQHRQYQAGVFWAGRACAISFRRATGVITNLSEFVPHLIS
ncbi:glutathionylspermidine synthase family protein [Hymenobacter fastidiosus]|uniref:Glutathionylspermidine synthase family protein n=1 Tax=Hymenobacter fastidiosus TaxID=486264 RepID=A0ABP7SKI2_9BACT